jgi:hypothetical protein
MKRGVRLALILLALLVTVSCGTKPEEEGSSGRSKEDAEAKHAELIRRQEELRRRYGNQQEQEQAQEDADA